MVEVKKEQKKPMQACLVCVPNEWFIEAAQFIKHCKEKHALNPRKYW